MAYTAQNIFDLAMDLIQKRLSSGTIDPTRTAKYKVLAPGILTLYEDEIATAILKDSPDAITALTQNVTVGNKTTAAHYLASALLIDENTDISNYFQQRYQELKFEYIRHRPVTEINITDAYAYTVLEDEKTL